VRRAWGGPGKRSGRKKRSVARVPGLEGYYCLAAASAFLESLTDEQRQRLIRYPVPIAQLGRLAVDRSAQGKGLGAYVLIDALRRVSRIEQEIGIHANNVFPIDGAAKKFYLKYGFAEVCDDQQRLIISMTTIRKLRLI